MTAKYRRTSQRPSGHSAQELSTKHRTQQWRRSFWYYKSTTTWLILHRQLFCILQQKMIIFRKCTTRDVLTNGSHITMVTNIPYRCICTPHFYTKPTHAICPQLLPCWWWLHGITIDWHHAHLVNSAGVKVEYLHEVIHVLVGRPQPVVHATWAILHVEDTARVTTSRRLPRDVHHCVVTVGDVKSGRAWS